MNVNCPECSFTYEIDDTKIPDGGVDAKCSNCGKIFEVLLKEQTLYLRTSNDTMYETTLREIKEWIIERRVLDYHEVSKDKIYWMQLKKHPELKDLFPTIEEETQELNSFDMGFTNKIKNELETELKEIKKNSKLDYREYDDEVENNEEKNKPKNKIFYLIIVVFIALGTFYFLKNRNLLRRWFDKVTNKESKENKYYIKAVHLLENSSFPLEYLRAKPLFEKAMEDVNKVEGSLAGLSLMNALNLFYYSVDYNIDIDIKNRILSLKDDSEEFNKLKKLLNILNKSIDENTNKISDVNLFFNNNLNKLKEISVKNDMASTALAIFNYVSNDDEKLKSYIKKIKVLDKNSIYLDFLNILEKELDDSDKLLQELKFKASKSAIVNYFIAQKYMKNGKYDLALISFKTVLTLVERHDNSMNYIDRLKFLLKYKDIILGAKKEKEIKTEKKNVKKENNNKKSIFSLEKELNKAWSLLDKGKIFEARKTFRNIIKVNPRVAQAYHGIGESYKIQNNVEKAIYYFERCLELKPNYEEANLLEKYIDKFGK